MTGTNLIPGIRNNFQNIFHAKQNRYQCIDGIRAIAVIYIVIFHLFFLSALYIPLTTYEYAAAQKYFSVIVNGDLAVDMFFTISGFLIANILLSEHAKFGRINISRFYIRRYARLMPVYFVAMMVILIYQIINRAPLLGNPAWIWNNFLYINNYAPPKNMFMAWTWSYAVEEQFYLLFPLTLLLIIKMKRCLPPLAAIAALFVLAIAIIIQVAVQNNISLPIPTSPFLGQESSRKWLHWFEYIYTPSYTRFGPIVCGFAVAYLHQYHHNKIERLFKYSSFNILLFVITIMIMLFIYSTPMHADVSFSWSESGSLAYIALYKNLYGMAIAIIILLCLYPSHFIAKLINAALSARAWYPIAQLSYCVSIFHPFIIILVYPHFYSISTPPTISLVILVSALVFAICFCIAVLTYILIERPIIDSCAGFFKRREREGQQLPTISAS